MRITACRKDLKYTFAYVHDSNIKSTTTKVENCNLIFTTLSKPVSHCCRSRLVYYPFYLKTCDLTGILGRLSLIIIKIGRHGDNSRIHNLT